MLLLNNISKGLDACRELFGAGVTADPMHDAGGQEIAADKSGRLVGGQVLVCVECCRDRGGRDGNRGGFDVDNFVAPPPAPGSETSVAALRQCAGVAAPSARWPSGDRRPALRDEQSRRSGRSGPRRLLCAGHIGSLSIGEPASEAREFANGALRIALEVLDHRRSIAHLDAIADPSVVSAVRTLVAGGFVPGRALGTAALTRVDVVMVNSDAAELCAAYDRGPRHFALAAHIARTCTDRWCMTALRVL